MHDNAPPIIAADWAAGCGILAAMELRQRVLLARLLWAFAALYLLAAVLLRAFQRRLFYYPRRELASTPAELGLDYRDVWLTAHDGHRLHAWYVPARNPRFTVLFLHGNGGNMSAQMDAVSAYHDLGCDVLYMDYRGYGQSDGVPEEQGLYADADTAWHYLVQELGADPHQIILVGRSLGGGVATWLAVQHPPRAMILEATFVSLPAVVAERFLFPPAYLVMNHTYPSRERLQQIHAPVLVVHSRTDQLIPYRHGKRLFAAAHQPKQMVMLSRGDHRTAFLVCNDAYRAGLQAFLETL